MIYDLSFHLYPRRDSDWRFHCRKLTENLHIFTGRRVIGIAYDDQTEHPQTVENEMYGCFETITVRNKPEYRETSTLIPRLWLLEDADPYGYPKSGVSFETAGAAYYAVQALALPYADHPDYGQGWRA